MKRGNSQTDRHTHPQTQLLIVVGGERREGVWVRACVLLCFAFLCRVLRRGVRNEKGRSN